jgi:type IV secretory pathway TraG/TraD family ATPase VirD4
LPKDKLLIVLESMKASKNYAMRIAANRAYDRLTDKNSQSTSLQDVIDTGLKSTKFLNDRRIANDMARGGAIDFAAMHRTITTVYLILPPLELEHQAKWLRMFVSLALRNLYKSAPTEKAPPTLPRVLLMLDEFGSLGRLQEISKRKIWFGRTGFSCGCSCKTSSRSPKPTKARRRAFCRTRAR